MVSSDMAVVKYAPGIEYVKGSLAKPKKQNGHNHGDYLIGTHRVAATSNTEGCTRLYVRGADTYVRTKPLSAKEIAARERFADVAAMVKARKSDLQNITTDQENFAAQVNTAGGKKTMKAYLWKVCGDIWDAQHS